MMTTTTANPIRIILIEDDELTRLGLRTQIGKDPQLEVAGEAANRKDALRIAGEEQPDIILLDLSLGDDSGLELLPELLSVAAGARVIVVTGGRDLEAHQRAISHGAVGLVLKQDAVEHVTRAVKQVYDGDVWFNRSMMLKVITGMAQASAVKKPDPEAAKIKTLTERERQVIGLVGEGLKNKVIADRLCISETTVRHHLTSVFAKLEVSDRLELVIYAFKHGLSALPK
jgi:two-component system, NarL family, nitrate/nitrite response regulator NarL